MRAWPGMLAALLAAALAAPALLLAGCASTPMHAPVTALFDDALFAPQAEAIDGGALFAPNAQMLAYIDSDISPRVKAGGRQRALFDALYDGDRPWLDYDATTTRPAGETFVARSGNCLSLVVMTAAFAKQLQLEVEYQSIDSWESWSRDQDLEYVNLHVNVRLLAPNRPGGGALLVDFMPVTNPALRRGRVISETTLVAMYMNNRSVELLARRELDRAYWWAKASAATDPRLLDPVNTLAIIYRARGRPAESEHALRWLLEREPDNVITLDNLARLLEAQGRRAEARVLAARVKELRPVAPFHFFDLGMQALKEQRFQAAKGLFVREMRRDARYDKFHAALALAHYGLGEFDQASAQMAIALDNATTAGDRQQYARMLANLRAGVHP